MARCAVCRRLHMRSLSPQLVSGSKPAPLVRAQNRRPAMATFQLNINGQPKQVNVDPSTPLLWVLREELKMTGTKYRSEERRVGKECRCRCAQEQYKRKQKT